MRPPTLLLYFEDESALAFKLADAASLALACVERHVFPDGEIKLRLPASLPSRVVVLRSLHHPNAKLVELLLSARTKLSIKNARLLLILLLTQLAQLTRRSQLLLKPLHPKTCAKLTRLLTQLRP